MWAVHLKLHAQSRHGGTSALWEVHLKPPGPAHGQNGAYENSAVYTTQWKPLAKSRQRGTGAVWAVHLKPPAQKS